MLFSPGTLAQNSALVVSFRSELQGLWLEGVKRVGDFVGEYSSFFVYYHASGIEMNIDTWYEKIHFLTSPYWKKEIIL